MDNHMERMGKSLEKSKLQTSKRDPLGTHMELALSATPTTNN